MRKDSGQYQRLRANHSTENTTCPGRLIMLQLTTHVLMCSATSGKAHSSQHSLFRFSFFHVVKLGMKASADKCSYSKTQTSPQDLYQTFDKILTPNAAGYELQEQHKVSAACSSLTAKGNLLLNQTFLLLVILLQSLVVVWLAWRQTNKQTDRQIC